MTYNPKVYREQGGARQVIASGGEIDIETGGLLKIAAVTVAASAGEINRTCQVSTRLVAGGATLAITEALHGNRVVKLDTAAGTICTLPASTGGGARYRFLITVIPTTNSHIVKVANASDTMAGIVLTQPDAAGAALAWKASGTDDTITLNRSTTGGTAIGEWLELLDSALNVWTVRGVTSATGAEATPFSATV